MSYSDTGRPEITVLLSCFNGGRWLKEAVDSVLQQTYCDFEFIIVDDGSTDDSLEIIRKFAEQDNRIVVIAKNNSGLADSLNVGIEQARGDWIARLDADDLCEASRLENQLARARQNSGLVFVGCGLKSIDENGDTSSTFQYPQRHDALVNNLLTMRKFPPHSSAFYHRDTVRKIGGYRPRMERSQDRDLWLRLSAVGQITTLTEPLVRIRRHLGQISHADSGKRQMIYSRAAVTSYWLRRYGWLDPLSADDETFEVFKAWVARRLERERIFELFDYISRLKVSRIGDRTFSSRTVETMRIAVSEPRLLFAFLVFRLRGETVSHKLAIDWIKRGKKCAG